MTMITTTPPEHYALHSTEIEQKVFKCSILCTFFIASAGIVVGLVCGSISIIFDGMFSILDAGMCSLSFISLSPAGATP